MSAATPENRARVLNRAARERALIEAAGKLFASRGYEATTTREIAAAAGCAEGLISRYFKGKAGLLRALVEVHFAEEVDEFQDHSPPAPTLGEEISRRIGWDVEHIGADYDFLRVIVPQVLLQPELGRELQELGPGRHQKLVAERLRTYSEFTRLPLEEQEALVQLMFAIGLMFGFWNRTMGQDRALAKQRAMIIGRILARAF